MRIFCSTLTPSFVILLCGPLLSACMDGGGTGNARPADAGVKVLDGGPVFIDAGTDSGVVVDAGPGEPTDAGFMLPTDGGLLPTDGGLPPLVEYEGEAEEGVVCGMPPSQILCAVGVACCVGIDAVNQTLQPECANMDGTCPNPLSLPFRCDDTQIDCTEGQECCAALDIDNLFQSNSQCLPAGECAANENLNVCTTTADCAEGLSCCGLDLGGIVPVDMGACQPACE